MTNNDLPKRKSVRLKNYDYSQSGAYFITICTQNKNHLFGRVENEKMILNEYGKIVSDEIDTIKNHYNNVRVEYSIVMPNHVHMIVIIESSNSYTDNLELDDNLSKYESDSYIKSYDISDIVGKFKAGVTRRVHSVYDNVDKIWQKSFYEHIIRNENDYEAVAKYIENNPINWEKDEEYTL